MRRRRQRAAASPRPHKRVRVRDYDNAQDAPPEGRLRVQRPPPIPLPETMHEATDDIESSGNTSEPRVRQKSRLPAPAPAQAAAVRRRKPNVSRNRDVDKRPHPVLVVRPADAQIPNNSNHSRQASSGNNKIEDFRTSQLRRDYDNESVTPVSTPEHEPLPVHHTTSTASCSSTHRRRRPISSRNVDSSKRRLSFSVSETPSSPTPELAPAKNSSEQGVLDAHPPLEIETLQSPKELAQNETAAPVAAHADETPRAFGRVRVRPSYSLTCSAASDDEIIEEGELAAHQTLQVYTHPESQLEQDDDDDECEDELVVDTAQQVVIDTPDLSTAPRRRATVLVPATPSSDAGETLSPPSSPSPHTSNTLPKRRATVLVPETPYCETTDADEDRNEDDVTTQHQRPRRSVHWLDDGDNFDTPVETRPLFRLLSCTAPTVGHNTTPENRKETEEIKETYQSVKQPPVANPTPVALKVPSPRPITLQPKPITTSNSMVLESHCQGEAETATARNASTPLQPSYTADEESTRGYNLGTPTPAATLQTQPDYGAGCSQSGNTLTIPRRMRRRPSTLATQPDYAADCTLTPNHAITSQLDYDAGLTPTPPQPQRAQTTEPVQFVRPPTCPQTPPKLYDRTPPPPLPAASAAAVPPARGPNSIFTEFRGTSTGTRYPEREASDTASPRCARALAIMRARAGRRHDLRPSPRRRLLPGDSAERERRERRERAARDACPFIYTPEEVANATVEPTVRFRAAPAAMPETLEYRDDVPHGGLYG